MCGSTLKGDVGVKGGKEHVWGPHSSHNMNLQGKTSIPLVGRTFECGEGVRVFKGLKQGWMGRLCLGSLSLTFIRDFTSF